MSESRKTFNERLAIMGMNTDEFCHMTGIDKAELEMNFDYPVVTAYIQSKLEELLDSTLLVGDVIDQMRMNHWVCTVSRRSLSWVNEEGEKFSISLAGTYYAVQQRLSDIIARMEIDQ